MNQWWQYWKGYFPASSCKKIVEQSLLLPSSTGKIGHGMKNLIEDKNVRVSQVRWLNRLDLNFMSLFNTIEQLFHDANKNAFGFDITRFNEIQFTEYDSANSGHYSWHQDTSWTTPALYRRKLSMVIQLSDSSDYTGGDFEVDTKTCLEAPNAEDIRAIGTVIVFPSFLLHRVTPVTTGIRHSLVIWMEGPPFK